MARRRASEPDAHTVELAVAPGLAKPADARDLVRESEHKAELRRCGSGQHPETDAERQAYARCICRISCAEKSSTYARGTPTTVRFPFLGGDGLVLDVDAEGRVTHCGMTIGHGQTGWLDKTACEELVD